MSAEQTAAFAGRRVLLVVGGGIAAYKSLDLVRRLKERGFAVRAIMTEAAKAFATPLAFGALTGERVFDDLFDLTAEHDIGHIRLARETDIVVVAPATADLLAKMAHGLAGDLATACLLATDKPILVAPAMNPSMWSHRATQRNLAVLVADGVRVVGPNSGAMAERGESGVGRMSEPLEIVAAVESVLEPRRAGRLAGRKVLVTAGPTHEPIDPVRYIANRSSGRQGFAIAAAAAEEGADVVLVSGPVSLADPPGVNVVRVETAREMMAAVESALPVDAAVMTAAVADWRTDADSGHKIKKDGSGRPPALVLVENPDILATLGHHPSGRPKLLVGFAAETDDLIANARAKLDRKGCDWIVANDVNPETGNMGGAFNTVRIVSRAGIEEWPRLAKDDVARRLVGRIADHLAGA